MQVRFGWQTDADGNDFFGAEVDNISIRYIGSDYTGETAYETKSGTSMAAPHVAGAAALLLANSPDMCLTELRDRLMWTGDLLSDLDGITVSGRRLNAYNALTAPPVLTVVTPNGGEHWLLGSTRTIRWVVFDCAPPDIVDIHLLKGGSLHSQEADNVPNTGMFSWSIPADLPMGGAGSTAHRDAAGGQRCSAPDVSAPEPHSPAERSADCVRQAITPLVREKKKEEVAAPFKQPTVHCTTPVDKQMGLSSGSLLPASM